MDKEYPIQGLVLCLRSDKSIKAINFSNSYPQPAPPNFNYNGGASSTYTSQQKPFNYCERQTDLQSGASKETDQIGESVSDWFAAEIIVDYIKQNHPNITQEQWQNGLTNVYKLLCKSGNHNYSEAHVHPPTEKRINAIFLANPKVREKLGCSEVPSKYAYCDAQKPEELMKNYGTIPQSPQNLNFPVNPAPSTNENHND